MPDYGFQNEFVEYAAAWVVSAVTGNRILFESPTGSGKSFMQSELQRRCGGVIITNRAETAFGYLAKRGYDVGGMGNAERLAACEREGIYTPIRYRNLLRAGAPMPSLIILDEAHHSEMDTFKEIYAYAGEPPLVGMTATPFRGTTKSTNEFREWWGGSHVRILSIKSAMDRGVIARPTIRVVPLVDDDAIAVANGEFDVRAAATVVGGKLGAIADTIAAEWLASPVPSMISVSGSELGAALIALLTERNTPAALVSQATPPQERQEIFQDAVAARKILVHINIVSEGVDLPLRRWWDTAPTMSPVKWQQMLGRILRPGGQPEYVCFNRNAERHLPILGDAIPAPERLAAAKAFPIPSPRAAMRVLGLEKLGRIKPATVQTVSGDLVTFFCFSTVVDMSAVSYAIILKSDTLEPILASRVDQIGTDGKTYGRWRRVDTIPDCHGFASISGSEPTPKQLAWWESAGRRYGIDTRQKPTRKQFQILPILTDIGAKL